jgi:hypothetical protein
MLCGFERDDTDVLIMQNLSCLLLLNVELIDIIFTDYFMATNKRERGRVIVVLNLKSSLQSMICFYQNVEQYNTTITTD